MLNYQKEFIHFILQQQVLKFGKYTLKSGRSSPYFFNSGLFNNGSSLATLAQFYAQTLITHEQKDFMLFGPAYKGIPLATATAMVLASQYRKNTAYAFNRKEIKRHGEGGQLIGAPLQGRVFIIDDVITAGLSIKSSFDIIQSNGAQLAGVVIALDRQEKSLNDERSACMKIEDTYGVPVYAIVSMDMLIEYLKTNPQHQLHLKAMQDYRDQYGTQTPHKLEKHR